MILIVTLLKSKGFCLLPQPTCTWNLKLKFQSKLDLHSGNNVVYRRMDEFSCYNCAINCYFFPVSLFFLVIFFSVAFFLFLFFPVTFSPTIDCDLHFAVCLKMTQHQKHKYYVGGFPRSWSHQPGKPGGSQRVVPPHYGQKITMDLGVPFAAHSEV